MQSEVFTVVVNYGDGTPVETLEAIDPTTVLAHTYYNVGSFTVTVQVTDEGGATDDDTTAVTVTNVDPVVTISPATGDNIVEDPYYLSWGFTDMGEPGDQEE